MWRSSRFIWIASALALLVFVWLFARREAPTRVGAPADAIVGTAPTKAELVVARPPGEVRVSLVQEESAARVQGAGPAVSPFRGRVLDAATGETIPWLQLVAQGSEQVQTSAIGADGRFACAEPLASDVQELAFDDPVHDSNVRNLSRDGLEPDPADPGGTLARIAIGPTYRLSVPGAEPASLAGWRARLLELGEDGSVRASGDWIRVHAVAPPFLRYDNPWKPNEAASSFVVELRNADGTRFGRSAPLASARGIYPELVVVHATEARATVRGRVVDTSGAPKPKATVTAASLERPSEPDAWPAVETDDTGAFELQGLACGAYRFTARPRRGDRPATRRAELAAGVLVLPDLVVPAQEPAGMIVGKLVSASGEPLTAQEHVRLRALDPDGLDMLDVTSPGGPQSLWPYGLPMPGRGEEGELVFEFNDVPAGRFELAVVGGSSLWDPPALVVSTPSESAVFTRRDDLARLDVRLSAVDAESGAALSPFFVQLQGAGEWNPASVKVADPAEPLAALSAGVAFRWTVHAPGYRPARGDESALLRSERGLEGRVALARGFGARFVLRDVDVGFLHDDEGGWISAHVRPPVAGATILADGAAVARSDARGVADVELAERPARFEIRAPGWRVIGSPQFRDGRVVGESPDVLVWLIAE